MTAALPWYPAARPIWDALWARMRAELGEGPTHLDWPEDLEAHWGRADIWMTQTCAPVWKGRLRKRLHAVGSFDFGLSAPGTYRSALVTRKDEKRATQDGRWRVAVNDFESQSGWGALQGVEIVGAVQTGSHAKSMDAIASGHADLAAIDGVSWRLSPHPALAVRAWTRPTPAPPVLTSDPARVAPLRRAIKQTLRAIDLGSTGIRGFVPLDAAHYAATPDLAPVPRCIRVETAA